MARQTTPRTKIAAAGTLAALGALAAVATASKPAPQAHRPAAVAAVRPAPVRTVVVHRTVGVRTKLVPAAPTAAAPIAATVAPAPAAAPAAVEPSPAPRAVAVRRAAAPAAARAADPAARVATDAERPVQNIPAPGVTAGECPTDGVADSTAETPVPAAPTRRPLPVKSSHPLPEDVAGAIVDGCDTSAQAAPGTIDPGVVLP